MPQTIFLVLLTFLSAPLVAETTDEHSYESAGDGTRELYRGDLTIKVLVEAANLGSSEVEVGEIHFPPGSAGGGHRHGSIEIFYVLSGTMDHVVNGRSHVLTPGMIGIVRPSDTVSHKVIGDAPVKAVVIWAPGGEVARLGTVFDERAVD